MERRRALLQPRAPRSGEADDGHAEAVGPPDRGAIVSPPRAPSEPPLWPPSWAQAHTTRP